MKSFQNIYENLPSAKKPEDLQKRNKNVNVTFLIRVFEKFSKTYPSIPEMETYKNKIKDVNKLFLFKLN